MVAIKKTNLTKPQRRVVREICKIQLESFEGLLEDKEELLLSEIMDSHPHGTYTIGVMEEKEFYQTLIKRPSTFLSTDKYRIDAMHKVLTTFLPLSLRITKRVAIKNLKRKFSVYHTFLSHQNFN